MSAREEMIRHLDTMELRPTAARQEAIELCEAWHNYQAPEFIGGRCEECGATASEGETICWHCHTANAAIEASVEEMRE
jgi:uncharacterized OB-fold protein